MEDLLIVNVQQQNVESLNNESGWKGEQEERKKRKRLVKRRSKEEEEDNTDGERSNTLVKFEYKKSDDSHYEADDSSMSSVSYIYFDSGMDSIRDQDCDLKEYNLSHFHDVPDFFWHGDSSLDKHTVKILNYREKHVLQRMRQNFPTHVYCVTQWSPSEGHPESFFSITKQRQFERPDEGRMENGQLYPVPRSPECYGVYESFQTRPVTLTPNGNRHQLKARSIDAWKTYIHLYFLHGGSRENFYDDAYDCPYPRFNVLVIDRLRENLAFLQMRNRLPRTLFRIKRCCPHNCIILFRVPEVPKEMPPWLLF